MEDDAKVNVSENGDMAKATKKQAKYDWYLHDWMRQAGKRQVDLIKELDWPKATANKIWNGQRYNRDLINELADWLHVQPYELLLPVAEAMAIRNMFHNAREIAAAHPAPLAVEETKKRA